jgi:hypothetical protein
MSSLLSRSLGGRDVIDRQAIRVNSQDYKDKWGIIEIILTSYGISGSGTPAGNVDVRPPNFNADNDEIYVVVGDPCLPRERSSSRRRVSYHSVKQHGRRRRAAASSVSEVPAAD